MMPPTFPTLDAVCFHADGRTPHLVQLMFSTQYVKDSRGQPVAVDTVHPELHMDHIANVVDGRAWGHQV